MSAHSYTKGLHDLGRGHYAYLVPDGSWGWSNAGLIEDSGQTLLVDTLFDLKMTAEMLKAMRTAVPASSQIGALINTHANGDHTFGNQLVEGARSLDQLIAKGVVAIGMGVDQGPNLRAGRHGGAHGLEHLCRHLQVKQGVDQQGLTRVFDQAGIGPAPTAVGHQISIVATAQIVQAFGVTVC